MRGIVKWLTEEDESTAAGVREGAHGGGNGGMEGARKLTAMALRKLTAMALRTAARRDATAAHEGEG